MTGAEIVANLLRADADVTGLVAAPEIKLGQLAANATLPTLLIRTVSSIDRQPLDWNPGVRITDRVAVTVRAASYRDQVAVMKAVRACCAGRTGDIGGGRAVSILTAGRGPDLAGPANSFEATQDLRVSFIDPA